MKLQSESWLGSPSFHLFGFSVIFPLLTCISVNKSLLS